MVELFFFLLLQFLIFYKLIISFRTEHTGVKLWLDSHYKGTISIAKPHKPKILRGFSDGTTHVPFCFKFPSERVGSLIVAFFPVVITEQGLDGNISVVSDLDDIGDKTNFKYSITTKSPLAVLNMCYIDAAKMAKLKAGIANYNKYMNSPYSSLPANTTNINNITINNNTNININNTISNTQNSTTSASASSFPSSAPPTNNPNPNFSSARMPTRPPFSNDLSVSSQPNSNSSFSNYKPPNSSSLFSFPSSSPSSAYSHYGFPTTPSQDIVSPSSSFTPPITPNVVPPSPGTSRNLHQSTISNNIKGETSDESKFIVITIQGPQDIQEKRYQFHMVKIIEVCFFFITNFFIFQ